MLIVYNAFTTVLSVYIVIFFAEFTSAGGSTSAMAFNTPTTDAPPTNLSTGLLLYTCTCIYS